MFDFTRAAITRQTFSPPVPCLKLVNDTASVARMERQRNPGLLKIVLSADTLHTICA